MGIGTSEGFPISKLNPFVLKKAIEGMVGDVKQVSNIRGDLIYIEVDRRIHTVKLLKTKHLRRLSSDFHTSQDQNLF